MKLIALFFLFCMSTLAHSAETALYETGPGQDSSFVRFLNGSDVAVVVVNGTAKLTLTTAKTGRVSRFFPVKAGAKLVASVAMYGQMREVGVVAKPGEFITIAVLPQAAGQWKTEIIREIPTDFNALRASLALVNLDPQCAAAGLQGGAAHQSVLAGMELYHMQRRLLNPVSLIGQVSCTNQTQVNEVDLGHLQAGERYSVFLLPVKSPRVLMVVDELGK